MTERLASGRLRRAFALLLLPLLASPLAAQEAPAARSAECDYDRCALRLDRGFVSGLRIVRGIESQEVARIRFLAPDLSALVAASDSAVHYARMFESRHNVGSVIALVGGIAVLVGFARAFDDFSISGSGTRWAPDDTADWLMFGGAVVGGIGTAVRQAGEGPLHRAIWWYNRDVGL